MRMLRWLCGVAKLDKINNDRIRWTTKGEIAKKVRERRLRLYGRVMRIEEHYVGRRTMKRNYRGQGMKTYLFAYLLYLLTLLFDCQSMIMFLTDGHGERYGTVSERQAIGGCHVGVDQDDKTQFIAA